MNANGALCVELFPRLPLVRPRRRVHIPRAVRSWTSALPFVIAIPLIAIFSGIDSLQSALVVPQVNSPYSIVGATEAEREVFAEIHQRYVEAGLELPSPIRVEFSEGTDICGEHRGRYVYDSHTIHFCRRAGEDWGSLPKLVIHELAHAWDDHNMTHETRSAYMSHFEIPESITWLDPGIPHDQRPGEMLAGTVGGVLQGIVDRARLDTMLGHG